jgi:hypothetical protein
VKNFQRNGIILSPKKIEVEKESIEFLGLVLNQTGLKLQEHIISKIKEFPEKIEDKKQLQSFLGILNYGRNFIKKPL